MPKVVSRPEFAHDHHFGLRGQSALCDFSKLRFWKSPYKFLNLYGRFCPYSPPYNHGNDPLSSKMHIPEVVPSAVVQAREVGSPPSCRQSQGHAWAHGLGQIRRRLLRPQSRLRLKQKSSPFLSSSFGSSCGAPVAPGCSAIASAAFRSVFGVVSMLCAHVVMTLLFLRLRKERESFLYVVPSPREGSSMAISLWAVIVLIAGINCILCGGTCMAQE